MFKRRIKGDGKQGQLQLKKTCPTCDGSGSVACSCGGYGCWRCGEESNHRKDTGTGYEIKKHGSGTVSCSVCDGSGEVDF